MKKLAHWLLAEIRAVIPATIFFLILFHLAALTKLLILESHQITATSSAFATVGALIMAKAILIANEFPFIDLFPKKPLLCNILWKTLIYGMLCFLFRYIEEIIPLLSEYGSVGEATRKMMEEISWPHFWAIQIWIVISLIIYTTAVEYMRFFGAEKTRKALLGPRPEQPS
jgi:hypothetical protein